MTLIKLKILSVYVFLLFIDLYSVTYHRYGWFILWLPSSIIIFVLNTFVMSSFYSYQHMHCHFQVLHLQKHCTVSLPISNINRVFIALQKITHSFYFYVFFL